MVRERAPAQSLSCCSRPLAPDWIWRIGVGKGQLGEGSTHALPERRRWRQGGAARGAAPGVIRLDVPAAGADGGLWQGW